MVLVYADNAALALAHTSADVLCDFACQKARDVETAVGEQEVSSAVPKSFNLVPSYGSILGGVFRIGGPPSTQKWEELRLKLLREAGEGEDCCVLNCCVKRECA